MAIACRARNAFPQLKKGCKVAKTSSAGTQTGTSTGSGPDRATSPSSKVNKETDHGSNTLKGMIDRARTYKAPLSVSKSARDKFESAQKKYRESLEVRGDKFVKQLNDKKDELRRKGVSESNIEKVSTELKKRFDESNRKLSESNKAKMKEGLTKATKSMKEEEIGRLKKSIEKAKNIKAQLSKKKEPKK